MTNMTVIGNTRHNIRNNLASTGTTTERTLVLKQIVQLQKAEAELGKKMLALGNGFDAMSERIELEHEMHGIDEQIKALQNLLLEQNADRKVVVAGAVEEKSVDATASVPTPNPNPNPKQRDNTAGTVIDVLA